MEREIKFRVWDIYKKVFIPINVFAITTSNYSYFAVMIEDWEDYKVGEYMYPNTQTIMQFTGLQDKKRNDIYENDIVKSKTVLGEGVSKIIWDTNSCCFTSKNLGSHIMEKETEFEILGNSFQNLELLESVQE